MLASLLITLAALVVLNVTAAKLEAIGDKAKSKCQEYASLVYAEEDSPTLRRFHQRHMFSKCPIVATPLIVGGVRAAPDEFPHMAAIGYGRTPIDEELYWLCGGSLISEQYVLTAAHCMRHLEKGPSQRVRFGTINAQYPEETVQEEIIANRIPHPDYNVRPKYNDIALLRLIRKLQLNQHVRPACLSTDPQLEWSHALASGFGVLKYQSLQTSSNLMKVDLNSMSDATCDEAYPQSRRFPFGILPSQFCAGNMSGGKDTCQGDSGGPLQIVLQQPYCMYLVVGVTSFGKQCGFKRSPGVYTRVASYVGWIESVVWDGGEFRSRSHIAF